MAVNLAHMTYTSQVPPFDKETASRSLAFGVLALIPLAGFVWAILAISEARQSRLQSGDRYGAPALFGICLGWVVLVSYAVWFLWFLLILSLGAALSG